MSTVTTEERAELRELFCEQAEQLDQALNPEAMTGPASTRSSTRSTSAFAVL